MTERNFLRVAAEIVLSSVGTHFIMSDTLTYVTYFHFTGNECDMWNIHCVFDYLMGKYLSENFSLTFIVGLLSPEGARERLCIEKQRATSQTKPLELSSLDGCICKTGCRRLGMLILEMSCDSEK